MNLVRFVAMKPIEPWKDPIVEEIRAVREAYAKRFAYDVRAICQDLQNRQDDVERTIVRPALRKGSTETGEAR